MRRLLALPVVVAVSLLAAGAADAGRTLQTLTCSGFGTLAVTVTITDNDHSVAWGTGKVSSSLHGIPVSSTVSVTDLTTNTLLFSFSQVKGGGNGMHNQPTVTCPSAPLTTTAGEAGVPGVNPTDTIEIDSSAQVVVEP